MEYATLGRDPHENIAMHFQNNVMIWYSSIVFYFKNIRKKIYY